MHNGLITFIGAALGVVQGSASVIDGATVAPSLLQRQHMLSQLEMLDTVMQPGEDCWWRCAERAGYCAWCGEGNACCRAGWPEDPVECKNAVFSASNPYHECAKVDMTKAVTEEFFPRVISNIELEATSDEPAVSYVGNAANRTTVEPEQFEAMPAEEYPTQTVADREAAGLTATANTEEQAVEMSELSKSEEAAVELDRAAVVDDSAFEVEEVGGKTSVIESQAAAAHATMEKEAEEEEEGLADSREHDIDQEVRAKGRSVDQASFDTARSAQVEAKREVEEEFLIAAASAVAARDEALKKKKKEEEEEAPAKAAMGEHIEPQVESGSAESEDVSQIPGAQASEAEGQKENLAAMAHAETAAAVANAPAGLIGGDAAETEAAAKEDVAEAQAIENEESEERASATAKTTNEVEQQVEAQKPESEPVSRDAAEQTVKEDGPNGNLGATADAETAAVVVADPDLVGVDAAEEEKAAAKDVDLAEEKGKDKEEGATEDQATADNISVHESVAYNGELAEKVGPAKDQEWNASADVASAERSSRAAKHASAEREVEESAPQEQTHATIHAETLDTLKSNKIKQYNQIHSRALEEATGAEKEHSVEDERHDEIEHVPHDVDTVLDNTPQEQSSETMHAESLSEEAKTGEREPPADEDAKDEVHHDADAAGITSGQEKSAAEDVAANDQPSPGESAGTAADLGDHAKANTKNKKAEGQKVGGTKSRPSAQRSREEGADIGMQVLADWSL